MIDTSKIVLIPVPNYRDTVAIKTSDISDLFEEIKRLENENKKYREALLQMRSGFAGMFGNQTKHYKDDAWDYCSDLLAEMDLGDE